MMYKNTIYFDIPESILTQLILQDIEIDDYNYLVIFDDKDIVHVETINGIDTIMPVDYQLETFVDHGYESKWYICTLDDKTVAVCINYH